MSTDEEDKVRLSIDAWCETLRITGLGFDVTHRWVDGVCVMDVKIYPCPPDTTVHLGFCARGEEAVALGDNVTYMLNKLSTALKEMTCGS